MEDTKNLTHSKAHLHDSGNDVLKKKSVVFGAVEGMALGVGISATAAVAADMLYTLFKTKKLTLPTPARIIELMHTAEFGSRLSMILPVVLGLGATHGYRAARRHNRKIDTFVARAHHRTAEGGRERD